MDQIAVDQLVQGRPELGRPGAEHGLKQCRGELGPITAAARIASWAAGLRRSTRDLTRRSSTCGSCGPAAGAAARCRPRGPGPASRAARSAAPRGTAGCRRRWRAWPRELRTGGAGTGDGTGDLAHERLGQRLLGARGQRPEHDLAGRRSGGQGRDLLAAGLRPAGRDTSRGRPAASSARSSVRRSEVGSAQCRSSRTRTVDPRPRTGSRSSGARRTSSLQVLGARPAGPAPDRRCPSSGPAAGAGSRSPSGWSALVPGPAGAWRRARPARPDPAGDQLPVEPIGGRGRVGGAAALEPERQPAAARADPGDEALPALLQRRVLPSPASPVRTTTDPWPSTACRSADSRIRISAPRPISAAPPPTPLGRRSPTRALGASR